MINEYYFNNESKLNISIYLSVKSKLVRFSKLTMLHCFDYLIKK